MKAEAFFCFCSKINRNTSSNPYDWFEAQVYCATDYRLIQKKLVAFIDYQSVDIRFAREQQTHTNFMKINKLLTAAIGLSLSAFVIGCGGGEAESTGPKYNYEKADSLPTGYLEELGVVKTNIEMTAKLYDHMMEKGYNYNESVMLSASKSFSGSSKQAMGIGAIGSDLVYAASFGQNQSAMDRMKGLMGAANSLGISEAFDEELMTKMASDDSTVNKSILLTKAYLNAKDQLFSEERAQYATFMIIGGWIEGLHISCQMMKDEIKDDEVRVGFFETVNSVGSVQHLCDVFESNAEMKSISEELTKLGPLMQPIRKNVKKYNTEQVAALAEAVAQLRNSQF